MHHVYLTMEPDAARRECDRIRHANCRRGALRRLSPDAQGRVRAQDVNWLRCWAETGQGSEDAMLDSCRVFNLIFRIEPPPVGESALDFIRRKVPHQWARDNRNIADGRDLSARLSDLLDG